jgi:hypothetical protein
MRDAEVQAVSVLEQLADGGDVSPETVRAVVTAATRLYARESERATEPLAPLAPEVSATEALTLACALLRSQDLTPFDMAVWFSKDGRANG